MLLIRPHFFEARTIRKRPFVWKSAPPILIGRVSAQTAFVLALPYNSSGMPDEPIKPAEIVTLNFILPE
jgi:hypothetical protein